MEELLIFLNIYGWQLALIALIGIVILGVLKYANLFDFVEKEKRKPIYFLITVGFSLIATFIYLAIIDQLTLEYFATVATAIYALNQTFYTIYENTNLRDLLISLLEFLKFIIKNRKEKAE